MKRVKLVSVIIILTHVFLCRCGVPVTFDEPQPANTTNLSKFPKRLQGEYLSLDNYSILTIDNKLIRRIFDFDDKIHLNQLDSTLRIVGDSLIDEDTEL